MLNNYPNTRFDKEYFLRKCVEPRPSDKVIEQYSGELVTHTLTTLSKMQNGFCVRWSVAVDYL